VLAVAVVATCAFVPGCADILDIRTSRYLEDDGGTKRCAGTLRVRVLYDATGPTKDVGLPGGLGVIDHLRAMDAEGGIRGCRVELLAADMRYSAEATLAAYREWQQSPEWNDVTTVFGQGSGMTLAIGPLAADEGKLVVTTAENGELASPVPISVDIGVPSLSDAFLEATVPARKSSLGYPFVFFQGTDYTTAARLAMTFAWKAGAKRVGFFACSTSAFCTNPVDGAKTFLPTLGGITIGRDLAIELDADEETIAQKTETYFRQELDHQKVDPTYVPVDWIWFGNTRTTLARLGRALARVKANLGVAPKVISNTFGLDELLFAECGEACVGFYGVQPLPIFGDRSEPGMARLVEVHAAARAAENAPASLYATTPFVIGYVAAAAWRAAVEAVVDDGQPVTGAALRAKMETFRQRPIAGLASVSYSATDHRPQSSVRVYAVQPSGVIAPVGQPQSIALQPGWLGW
jgi:ABC-type branched-subunit amino acid transport system substrate-binding protein